jgi:hypothetical protein
LSAYTVDTRRIAERVAVVNTHRALFGKLGCRLATRRSIELSEIGGHPNLANVRQIGRMI